MFSLKPERISGWVPSPRPSAVPAERALRVRELAQGLPMPRTRHLRACPDARACRERQPRRSDDLFERERVEPWRDLALEPRLVALARMLAGPAAIAAMSSVIAPPRMQFTAAFLRGSLPV
jgi:hypothetical protein